MSSSSSSSYTSLEIIQEDTNNPSVFTLYLNRPTRHNALSLAFFSEFPRALSSLDQNPEVSVIVLSGRGKHFCAGIDLAALNSISSSYDDDVPSDRGRSLLRQIYMMQEAVSAIEKCRKVVVAAVNGACIGGGIDIITACDIRYCCEDAKFSVKEVDVAITADLGTLQRLPGIVGFGNAMELALTGRLFGAEEAKGMGLVSKVFGNKNELDQGVHAIAQGFASKSPLAVIGTKNVLLKSRDMSVQQGLDYVATWNSSMLLSDDLKEVISAQKQKRKPSFSKL
ncbi:delta(3,5)-delta(2,4)-dienoyl-CoA isomerase, peroxisomal, partial [Tanacetum coccineum]